MIDFTVDGNTLLLAYESDRWNDARWLDQKFKQEGQVTLRRTFTFTKADLLPVERSDDDQERVFTFGVLEGNYYRINKNILGVKHDLLLSKSLTLSTKLFIANRDISVFRKIDELVEERIVIGGEREDAIPLDDFNLLLKEFPTTTELTHYARARISRVLKDYFGNISDAERNLNTYLARSKNLGAKYKPTVLENLELHKFEYIRSELSSMLKVVDGYTEKDWQLKILELLLFVFPKYIAVLENVHIKDFYSRPGKTTDRYIDLMLVDANGSIDVIEVKKPFSNALLSRNKYRDNHTPRGELAGTVMQAEKYLFHLNKWGCAGEQEIYKKRKGELPEGIELKITNPKAMILLGRDESFTSEQRFDFEIIRRKYANVIDIMTYDDLLRRLDNIIVMLKRSVSEPSGGGRV